METKKDRERVKSKFLDSTANRLHKKVKQQISREEARGFREKNDEEVKIKIKCH